MKMLLIVLSVLTLNLSYAGTQALFSPHQGNQAFNKIYKAIENAEKYVHATIYSWSDSTADKYIFNALKKGVKVRIVLHPKLYNDNSSVQKRIYNLEKKGAEIKIANQQMHEKFFLIDGTFLVNSSANMSGGARKRYSENFIFFDYDETNPEIISVFKDFRQEFSLLWDSAKDIFTHGENAADALFDFPKDKDFPIINTPNNQTSIALFSSSMNFKYYKNNNSDLYKKGIYLIARPIKVNNRKIWTVKSRIIKAIREAKSTILVNMNHFFLPDVRTELVKAAKRGIDVRMTVDNQEYKDRPTGKTETARFVNDWLKINGNQGKEPPVRVKYYSHLPSPVFWHLNHHKYMIFDYDLGAEKTVLITGSYNLSITAEHYQYDNMVVVTGQHNKYLFDKFKQEFDNLWFYNRTESDRPSSYYMDLFTKPNYKGEYPLHIKNGVSLEWSEAKELRTNVKSIVPGLFKGIYNYSNCLFYNPKYNKYTECIELQ